MIPWNNESVWLDALPQNKTVSGWPVFHGSVILPYILKAIWCMNMKRWANKSVWLDAWPQNKSWSLWPIFHGSVAYILKTILCIRRWHWPGVYVSPCSLALVFFFFGNCCSVRSASCLNHSTQWVNEVEWVSKVKVILCPWSKVTQISKLNVWLLSCILRWAIQGLLALLLLELGPFGNFSILSLVSATILAVFNGF